MSWLDIKARFGDLVAARDATVKDGVAPAWQSFQEAATAEGAAPFHLTTLMEQIAAVHKGFPDMRAADLTILDHGCGSGITLLYLLANGYRLSLIHI